MRKFWAYALALTLSAGLFVGCTTPEANTGGEATPSDKESQTSEDKEDVKLTPEEQKAIDRIEELAKLDKLEDNIVPVGEIDYSQLEGVKSAQTSGYIKASTAESMMANLNDTQTVAAFRKELRNGEGDPLRPPYMINYYTNDLIITSISAGSLMRAEYVFPVESDEASAVTIVTQYNKISGVAMDEFNGSTADNYGDFDYRLTIYPAAEFYLEPEGFDFLMKSMKHINGTYDDFTEEFGVNNLYARITSKDSLVEKRLYFLSDGKDNENSNYFFEVIAKEGQIVKVNKVDAKIDLPNIARYLNL